MIPFRLWRAQERALALLEKNRFCIVLKARQLGMSWLVLCYALHGMLTRPGSTVVAVSRTETEAKELVRRLRAMTRCMPEFFGGVPGGFHTQESVLRVSLAREGGAWSTFQAFASAPGAARSFSADLLLFDEWAYQQQAEELWLSGLPTVNRPQGGQVVGISTMQPGSFFERLWMEENGPFTRIFLPWSADPRRDAAWYARTRALLGENIFREYPASPEEAMRRPQGAFFREFDRHRHVCEPFEIPAAWRRYFAMDYGLDMLAGLWAAVDGEGRVYVYREVYRPDLPIAQAARAILQAEAGEDVYVRYAPPDLFGRSQESGRPRTELFAQAGIVLEKAGSDRQAGWAGVQDYLREAADGRPRLLIFPGCENLIRTLGSIPRDKRRPDDCATEPHELTHAPDALRYLLSMRPRGGEKRTDARTQRYYEQVDDLLQYGR